MSHCQDCGGEHAPRAAGQPCPCCAGDTATVEPCPGCDQVPADRATGYGVLIWVEGPAVQSQEAADALVGAMLDVALPGAPEGTTASVVPE